MAERRRLPVIQSKPPEPSEPSPEDSDDEKRPPWHWVGFGTVAIFAAWLPLSYLAGWLARRGAAPYVGGATTAEEVALKLEALSGDQRLRLALIEMLPHVMALAIGAFAGGFLVGRFGPGKREAAMSGAMTAIIAMVLAGAQTGFSPSSLVAVALGVAFAWLGGRSGVRSKT